MVSRRITKNTGSTIGLSPLSPLELRDQNLGTSPSIVILFLDLLRMHFYHKVSDLLSFMHMHYCVLGLTRKGCSPVQSLVRVVVVSMIHCSVGFFAGAHAASYYTLLGQNPQEAEAKFHGWLQKRASAKS